MKIFNVLKRIKSGKLPNVRYMFKRIWAYACEYSKEYGASKLSVFADYLLCAMIYGCSGEDYFLYNFRNLKPKGKKAFVTDTYEDNFAKAHTDKVQKDIINNKERTLHHFKEYVGRDWCGVEFNNSEEHYAEFYAKHAKCILKPQFGSGGHGIEIVDLHERFKSGEEFRRYAVDNEIISEELIIQHDELNRMYPNAVNTIRIVTVKGKCIGAALRMGVGNAAVDNGHSGGIYTEVDVSSGIIVCSAMKDSTRERFIKHPTTGAVIPGFKIPYWEKCKAMVEEAGKLVPDVYLVGWDVAVTQTGPAIVEANAHPGLSLIQAPNGHGLKEEFEKIKD